jgi:hypothetical protein
MSTEELNFLTTITQASHPKAEQPILFTPWKGSDKERKEEREINNGRHVVRVRGMAGFFGSTAEHLIAADAYGRRQRFKEITEEFPEVVTALHLNPWARINAANPKVEAMEPYDERIAVIQSHIEKWRAKGTVMVDWLLVNDEYMNYNVAVDGFTLEQTREYMLARTYAAWEILRQFSENQCWYNHRQVKYAGAQLATNTHPLTPGPMGCSLYYTDPQRSANTLCSTGRPMVPWLCHNWAYVYASKDGDSFWDRGPWMLFEGPFATAFCESVGRQIRHVAEGTKGQIPAIVSYAPRIVGSQCLPWACNAVAFSKGLAGA